MMKYVLVLSSLISFSAIQSFGHPTEYRQRTSATEPVKSADGSWYVLISPSAGDDFSIDIISRKAKKVARFYLSSSPVVISAEDAKGTVRISADNPEILRAIVESLYAKN